MPTSARSMARRNFHLPVGGMKLELDDLTPRERRFVDRILVHDGQLCTCCGRRKPTKERTPHLENDGAWIPRERVMFIFQEIENRVGRENAARMIPYSRVTLRKLMLGKKPYVRKSTVSRAIACLRELRANDVVYSRDTIRLGLVARGKSPQRPKDWREYYHPNGDREAEYKRRSRGHNRQANENL
jgi:hypothetical protein